MLKIVENTAGDLMRGFFIFTGLILLLTTSGHSESVLPKDLTKEPDDSCKANSDCRLVTSYIPPEHDLPAKTIVKCSVKTKPLQEGEWLAEYNADLTNKCVCIDATNNCALKE